MFLSVLKLSCLAPAAFPIFILIKLRAALWVNRLPIVGMANVTVQKHAIPALTVDAVIMDKHVLIPINAAATYVLLGHVFLVSRIMPQAVTKPVTAAVTASVITLLVSLASRIMQQVVNPATVVAEICVAARVVPRRVVLPIHNPVTLSSLAVAATVAVGLAVRRRVASPTHNPVTPSSLAAAEIAVAGPAVLLHVQADVQQVSAMIKASVSLANVARRGSTLILLTPVLIGVFLVRVRQVNVMAVLRVQAVMKDRTAILVHCKTAEHVFVVPADPSFFSLFNVAPLVVVVLVMLIARQVTPVPTPVQLPVAKILQKLVRIPMNVVADTATNQLVRTVKVTEKVVAIQDPMIQAAVVFTATPLHNVRRALSKEGLVVMPRVARLAVATKGLPTAVLRGHVSETDVQPLAISAMEPMAAVWGVYVTAQRSRASEAVDPPVLLPVPTLRQRKEMLLLRL